MFGLAALILVFGPVSGAHFNPVVSAADWLAGHRRHIGLTVAELGVYTLAQTGGAVIGAIGAAYWFTSSTSFANPAVTIRRIFSDTFAGIAPTSAPAFTAAQIIGGAIGLALVGVLYPGSAEVADDVVVPHHDRDAPLADSRSPR